MITKDQHEKNTNVKCFLCKLKFNDQMSEKPNFAHYAIRCARPGIERNIWFCRSCWIEFAGEGNLFWNFGKEKL